MKIGADQNAVPDCSETDGTPIGIFDTMIAGHALALKAVLFTNNSKHFQKAKALKLENWLE